MQHISCDTTFFRLFAKAKCFDRQRSSSGVLLQNLKNQGKMILFLSPIFFYLRDKKGILYLHSESRRMRWAKHVECMGEERGVYRVLVGKPEGKRPLGRPRRRWVDNIRRDLQEVGCGYMDWIGLAQDRDRWRTLVSAVMNLRVPWNAGNFLTSCKPVSFSRRSLHHAVSMFSR